MHQASALLAVNIRMQVKVFRKLKLLILLFLLFLQRFGKGCKRCNLTGRLQRCTAVTDPARYVIKGTKAGETRNWWHPHLAIKAADIWRDTCSPSLLS